MKANKIADSEGLVPTPTLSKCCHFKMAGVSTICLPRYSVDLILIPVSVSVSEPENELFRHLLASVKSLPNPASHKGLSLRQSGSFSCLRCQRSSDTRQVYYPYHLSRCINTLDHPLVAFDQAIWTLWKPNNCGGRRT